MSLHQTAPSFPPTHILPAQLLAQSCGQQHKWTQGGNWPSVKITQPQLTFKNSVLKMRILNLTNTLIWPQQCRGRDRRRMAVAGDHTSTPSNCPQLHRAERCMRPQPGARELCTPCRLLQCLALAAWHSHLPFLKPKGQPPSPHTRKSSWITSPPQVWREDRLDHFNYAGTAQNSHTSALYIVERLQKHIQDFGRATSRAGTLKLHCTWTKDVSDHTDPSPLPNSWTGWLEKLYKFSTPEDPPKLWWTS